MDLLILGPVEMVDEDGASVHVPGVRPRAVLALLALRPSEVVSTDSILEAIWGGTDIANREAALHSTVNRLRQAVGRGVVETQPGGYRLNLPAGRVDRSRFESDLERGRHLLAAGDAAGACEALRRALGQWRGSALTDLRRFEFAEQAGRQLDEARLEAIEVLMKAMLADGAHEQVAGELTGLVEQFPFREGLWGLLMTALYRSGRQADALAAYRRIRNHLGEELGIEPSPALADLEERILLHDPNLSDYARAPVDVAQEIGYATFRAGEVIVQAGTPASQIYWVEEGEVAVLPAAGHGQAVRPSTLGPGNYFGELAAILGTAHSATVSAVVATTVSLYDVESFRARINMDGPGSQPAGDLSGEVSSMIRRGHYLQAYDTATHHLERGEANPLIRYLAVLALARSGATAHAKRRHDQFNLARLDGSTLAPRLAHDIKVLAARLDKDQALTDVGRQAEWAKRAAKGYEDVYTESREPYHAVNAATMWLLSGQFDHSLDLARAALADCEPGVDDYWDAATEAEAALLAGDVVRAASALDRAAAHSTGLYSERATTLKQLKLVCHLKGVDPAVLSPIHNPTVIHFSGHRTLALTDAVDSLGTEQTRIRAEIDRALDEMTVGIGFGSLAAGADILVAEALIERGAELNVVLPFPRDEFVKTSVEPAGDDWAERFERCVDGAATVELATTSQYMGDPVLFDYCAQIAMGIALIRADQLETSAHQLAIWDGGEASDAAGTAVDVGRWEASGFPASVISAERRLAEPVRDGPAIPRQIRAVVVATYPGQANLTDEQVLAFQVTVVQRLNDVVGEFTNRLVAGESRNDGMRMVFDDVGAAADCALALNEAAESVNLDAAGLGQLKGLRVTAHAAPVFEGTDPLSGRPLIYGEGVNEAVIAEPRTPPGEVYATRAFAALATLAAGEMIECQYVGIMPTARQLGQQPLYALRRKRDQVQEVGAP